MAARLPGHAGVIVRHDSCAYASMTSRPDLQGDAGQAAQAQLLLLEAVAWGLVALPHAATCLLSGKTASPWTATLLGNLRCPLAKPIQAQTGLLPCSRLGHCATKQPDRFNGLAL